MKWIRYLIIPVVIGSCGQDNLLEEIKVLENYPSASGIEYRNGRVFIIGDDANNLLITDSLFNITDSLSLYNFPERRIPKSQKPDLEGLTIISDHELLLIGSGSLAPQRNIAWTIDLDSEKKDSVRLDQFYERLLLNGIKELNIEGITRFPGGLVLTNRGNKSYRKNHLIFAAPGFWKRQQHSPFTTMLVGSTADTSYFNGVSGIDYAFRSDALIMTVSTEDTRNALDDGAIGKSYLWIVNNISSKKSWKAINPDKVIDLDAMDPRFKGQKIESVCVVKETRKLLYLLLAADNDDGSSTLFRLVVSKD
jgi:hypothetical protein